MVGISDVFRHRKHNLQMEEARSGAPMFCRVTTRSSVLMGIPPNVEFWM